MQGRRKILRALAIALLVFRNMVLAALVGGRCRSFMRDRCDALAVDLPEEQTF